MKTGIVLGSSAGTGKPWTEAEARGKLRDAAGVGVEFVHVPSCCRLTHEQFTFLHDRGIRTACCAVNDAKTMVAMVRDGHDFIFTDDYVGLRPIYEKALAAYSV